MGRTAAFAARPRRPRGRRRGVRRVAPRSRPAGAVRRSTGSCVASVGVAPAACSRWASRAKAGVGRLAVGMRGMAAGSTYAPLTSRTGTPASASRFRRRRATVQVGLKRRHDARAGVVRLEDALEDRRRPRGVLRPTCTKRSPGKAAAIRARCSCAASGAESIARCERSKATVTSPSIVPTRRASST